MYDARGRALNDRLGPRLRAALDDRRNRHQQPSGWPPSGVEFGCDYCADEHNFHYGHVTQIGASGPLPTHTPASSTAIRRTNLTHHDAPSHPPRIGADLKGYAGQAPGPTPWWLQGRRLPCAMYRARLRPSAVARR
jgi:hypothetical protein